MGCNLSVNFSLIALNTTTGWVIICTTQKKKELVLNAYVGEPTNHTHIPFGKGICGQVALSNKNFIVDDVNAQDNYIACSLEVKSEIVIPLFVSEKNIGQIDIDSNRLRAFSEKTPLFWEK